MALRPISNPNTITINTPGTSDGVTVFDDVQRKLWASNLLEAYSRKTVYTQPGIANRDYVPVEGARSVEIPSITGTEVIDESFSLGTPSELTDSTQTLVLDQAKVARYPIRDVHLIQSATNIIEVAGREAGWKLAYQTDKWLANKIAAGLGDISGTTANSQTLAYKLSAADSEGNQYVPYRFANTTENDGELFLNLLFQVKEKMDKYDVPAEGRWCIIPPEMERLGFLDDSRLVGTGTQMSETRVANGFLRTYAGFDVMCSNHVPDIDQFQRRPGDVAVDLSVPADNDKTDAGEPARAAGDVGKHYRILCGHSSAVTFAMQVGPTGPETYRAEGFVGLVWRMLTMYGALVTRPKALFQIYADCVTTANRS